MNKLYVCVNTLLKACDRKNLGKICKIIVILWKTFNENFCQCIVFALGYLTLISRFLFGSHSCQSFDHFLFIYFLQCSYLCITLKIFNVSRFFFFTVEDFSLSSSPMIVDFNKDDDILCYDEHV